MEKNKVVIETQMLIRKPIKHVFQAFIDPDITKNFWFTKSSGKLEPGKSIIWQWEMYGALAEVFVKDIIANEKILIEWGDPITTVEFLFMEQTDQATYVIIKNYGFDLKGDQLIQAIINNTGGFTTVLDGLKAYLEYNIPLNLIGDKFPNKFQFTHD